MTRRTAQDEFDDLYEGFDDSSVLGTDKDVVDQEVVQRAIQTSYGEKSRGAPSRNLRTGRLGTGKSIPRAASSAKVSTGSKSETFRPASSIRGTGYSAKSNRSSASSGVGSPSGRLSSGTPITVPPLDASEVDQTSKRWEKEVRSLLDEIVLLTSATQYAQALEKLKQVEKLRRNIQEISDLKPSDVTDLVQPLLFKISWHHAELLSLNHKFNEAIKMYTALHSTVGKGEQLHVISRIAAIHRRRGEYEPALRLLHKILDDLPAEDSLQKIGTLQQAAACCALMGRWETAYKYCQMVLQDADSLKAAFNSLVCLIAMKSDDKKVENAFLRLIAVKPAMMTPEANYSSKRQNGLVSEAYLDVIRQDSLHDWEESYKSQCHQYVQSAAELVTGLNPDDVINGYDWCISKLKGSAWENVTFALEMAKASTFMKLGEYAKTIEILTSHDSDVEENSLRAQSCNLLAFLYFHLDNQKLAHEYAVKAYSANKSDIKACVNMGCMEYANGDFSSALQYFQEALVLNSSDFHAIFYAGITLSALKNYNDAMAMFLKLNSSHRKRATVLWQIAHQNELLGDLTEAFSWFQQVYALHPNEPFVLERLGSLADRLGDKGAALWYYNESHRIYPSNFEVLNWLGRFFVASQFPEKAIKYFEFAEKLDSSVPKWALLAAGAMRRAGHLTDAYEKYVQIHSAFPEDVDCLKILVRICQETSAPSSEIQKYRKELDLLQRLKPTTAIGARPQSGRRTATTEAMDRLSTSRKFPFQNKNEDSSSSFDRYSQITQGFNLDAEDLEQFDIRPGTAVKSGGRPAVIHSDGDDLNVDDILPGLSR